MKNLQKKLSQKGLSILGILSREKFHHLINNTNKDILILIGNKGNDLEKIIENELNDKQKNPLDHWTETTLKAIANEYQGEILFPFQGPPYVPFQKLALLSGNFFSSPIKMLIHHKWGLWTGFRGALLLSKTKVDTSIEEILTSHISPCEDCPDKPCLSACPIDAFNDDQYLYQKCLKEVAKKEDCFFNGCQARRACPVGVSYGQKQKAFHMKAFCQNIQF